MKKDKNVKMLNDLENGTETGRISRLLQHTLSESLKMAMDERLAAKDKEDVSSSW